MGIGLPQKDIIDRLSGTIDNMFPFRRNASPGQVELPTKLVDDLFKQAEEVTIALSVSRKIVSGAKRQIEDMTKESTKARSSISALKGQIRKLKNRIAELEEETVEEKE